LRILISAFSLLAALFTAPTPPAALPSHADFGPYWHDGNAEIDGYRLTVLRYGKQRVGQGVQIYVTEPFSVAKHVKVDDPARNPADTFDALKLNFVRRFQTGIYDYHTMVSLFSRSQDFSPVKVAFTSSEWCGAVYDEMTFTGRRLSRRFSSYFEDESASQSDDVPRDGVVEDNLFILLRGLRGAYLNPGEKRSVSLLPSPFYTRLTHQRPAWTGATVERLARTESVRVPAGTFRVDVYVVNAADGRKGRFLIERDYPHRVIRWAWKAAPSSERQAWLGGIDSGELTGSARLPYWKLHDADDESYLKRLGLKSVRS
jgi:hypothetical protein